MNAVELAQKSSALFTLPDVYMKLQQLIRKPETSIDDIAELISTDAALTARLLKIANSSFYSFPAEIGTISRAINLIGTDQLMNLVLATSVAGSFSGVPADVIDMDSFWRHNVDTALIARSLAGACKQPDIERLFVIGLLHNVGKLIALTEMPEQSLQALLLEPDENAWQKQYDVLGFTFAECGAELLSVWELPASLVETVRFQHTPGLAGDDEVCTGLLNIASRAASAMEQEICPDEGPQYLELIDEQSWDLTGLQTTDLDVSIAYAQEEAWNMLGVISSAVY
ncbi:MAG: HDOD domain-containing protein [Pseudomonadales bacterium]